MEIKNATLIKATEPTEETPDNAALIASAIHDMRAAFNNLCDIINAANGIDDYNNVMFRDLISDIRLYYKCNILYA